MAIPKPKPELAENMWMDAVAKRICVHIALAPNTYAHPFEIPYCSVPWNVCGECREELERRFMGKQF